MTELTERLLRYQGFSGTDGWCHLAFAAEGAVLGELRDNPGTSVTNALELVTSWVVAQFFNGNTQTPIFEWLSRDPVVRKPAIFEIKWHGDGFRQPEWVAPEGPPGFVEEAMSRISSYVPYTLETVRARGVEEENVGDARDLLAEFRRKYPPGPAVPDRRPT